MANVQDIFYVSLNCEEKLSEYPDYNNLSAFSGHSFDKDSSKVTITYDNNGSTLYTFPAAIYRGKQTVHVTQKGIYRISEMSDWSKTDYDFWIGSNIYTGNGADDKSGNRIKDCTTNDAGDFVIFSVAAVSAENYDKKNPDNRLTASFTNCETEYAYINAQAYAENTIKLK